jgi:hypothetical protein
MDLMGRGHVLRARDGDRIGRDASTIEKVAHREAFDLLEAIGKEDRNLLVRCLPECHSSAPFVEQLAIPINCTLEPSSPYLAIF